jgi:hypothetical protein
MFVNKVCSFYLKKKKKDKEKDKEYEFMKTSILRVLKAILSPLLVVYSIKIVQEQN